MTSSQADDQSLWYLIGRSGIKRTFVDHPDNTIIKIDQNTEKSPEDLNIQWETVSQRCWEELKRVVIIASIITDYVGFEIIVYLSSSFI